MRRYRREQIPHSSLELQSQDSPRLVFTRNFSATPDASEVCVMHTSVKSWPQSVIVRLVKIPRVKFTHSPSMSPSAPNAPPHRRTNMADQRFDSGYTQNHMFGQPHLCYATKVPLLPSVTQAQDHN
jgi:hypothetical protein